MQSCWLLKQVKHIVTSILKKVKIALSVRLSARLFRAEMQIKFLQIRHHFRWLSVFTKWKQFVLTWYVNWVPYSQWEKKILPFVAFFSRLYIVLFWSTFLIVCWGTCPICYRHYCPSLLTVLQLSAFPRNFSNLQMIIIILSGMNVKISSLLKGDESEKKIKLFIFSAPNDFPNNFLKHCTRALNHPVHATPSMTVAFTVQQNKNTSCCWGFLRLLLLVEAVISGLELHDVTNVLWSFYNSLCQIKWQ
jgi:hypothetical protein